MKKELNMHLGSLINEEKTVLNYLKSKYPLFHRSNVFFRDIQFGIKHYLENKEIKLTYTESEILANEFIKYLISKGILKKISDQIFLLNYPDFNPQKKLVTNS